jgi:hypothetical protein
MGSVVVVGAEQHAVFEVGAAAVAQGFPAWWASHQAAGMSQPSVAQVG